jgi:hypothetical protein
MNRDDWLYVGCKLIGLYLGLQGLLNLAFYGCQVIEEYARGFESPDPFAGPVLPIDLYRITVPVCYLSFAYLLTHRTEWCVRFITPEQNTASVAPPDEQS